MKNNPAKFHPDPIWNDRALGFFFAERRTNKKKNKMSSDMRSVPDVKISRKKMKKNTQNRNESRVDGR